MDFDKQSDQVFLVPGDDVRKSSSNHILFICLLVLILSIVGFANLYSASFGGNYFQSQLKKAIFIAPFFFIVGFLVPIRKINTYGWWIYGVTLVLLTVVFVLGRVAGGAQRWITIGPIGFQPSEIAKLVVAIITAKFFAAQRISSTYRLRDLLPIVTTVGIIFVLIFLQPDFGTAGLCLFIFLCQLYFIRIDRKSIILVGLLSPVIAILGWTTALRPYQKLRILNLVNPDLDPQNTGYNSLQSLIAVGSGNAFGKGFMQGTQAQLRFLPERHTDFIFSVFAEEHGFWGGVFVFSLFLAITYIALAIARQSKDVFCSLLAVGIAAFLFLEFTINIAMVLGLFPVVGLPLPFFSYGSSNLLTVYLALGFLIAISRENQLDRNMPRTEFTGFPKIWLRRKYR